MTDLFKLFAVVFAILVGALALHSFQSAIEYRREPGARSRVFALLLVTAVVTSAAAICGARILWRSQGLGVGLLAVLASLLLVSSLIYAVNRLQLGLSPQAAARDASGLFVSFLGLGLLPFAPFFWLASIAVRAGCRGLYWGLWLLGFLAFPVWLALSGGWVALRGGWRKSASLMPKGWNRNAWGRVVDSSGDVGKVASQPPDSSIE